MNYDKMETVVKEYILEDMIPKRLTEDSGKVLKVKMVRDVHVKELCKSVSVNKSIIICD